MIPLKLTLKNFTSYGENPMELDFTKFKLAAISGLNGAGKSSLLDSITWCIWGSSRAGDSADELIHSGADQMQVEFIFELDGHEFIVKRQRIKKGGGSTALEFWSKSHNLTEGTIKATQQKIIDTLHLNFETFTNSAYLRQGHADEFTTKGPTDRKRILADILGLSQYDTLEAKAKEKSKEAQTRLAVLEYQLIEIEAELTQKEEGKEKKKIAEEKIIQIESQIKNFEEILKNLRNQKETLSIASKQRLELEQSYLQNKAELEEIISRGKSRKEKIGKLETEIEKLKSVQIELSILKNLQKEKAEFDEIRQKKLETEKLHSDILGQINLKKQQIDQLQKQLEEFKNQLKESGKPNARCPTCGQEIGKGEKQHILSRVSDQIKTTEKKISEIDFNSQEKEAGKLEALLKTYIFNSFKYQEIIKKLDDLEKLQEQKETLAALQASAETEQKVVLEMRELFKNKNELVAKQKIKLENLPDTSEKLSLLNREIAEIENKINLVRGQEKEARGTLGQINELISRTAQMEKLQIEKNEEKIKLQKEKEIFDELSLAFGKKGIQAMIIENAIPEIELEANNLLSRLTEGRMKIKLETQRETKTKIQTSEGKTYGIVETLDIIISDEMGERPYELYSGGESFRVNFAIRLAISKLLTHRAGTRLQFLVIDEGFGTQDAPGRARLVEVLDAIKDDFEKILVITHIEELKEEFPVRVEVSKTSSGSTFEVVGV